MEEKEEFADILIEENSKEDGRKMKKILLLVGVFILIFLVIMLLMKIINTPEEPKDDFIAMQTKSESASANTNDDASFKQVPIIQEESKQESFEEMVKKLKAKEAKRAHEEKELTSDTDEKASDTLKKASPSEVTHALKTAPKIDDVSIFEKEAKQEQKQEKPKQMANAPKQLPKITKPEIKQKTSQKALSSSIPSGYYVQVLASTNLNPDKIFIEKVQKQGYKYELLKTKVKGKEYLKVLIGPFASKASAVEKMPDIKSQLNKNAFLFSVK